MTTLRASQVETLKAEDWPKKLYRCHAQGRRQRYSGEWKVADGHEPPDPETSILITEVETCEVVPAERATQLEAALREIASYNPGELREWEEENAADMVEIARKAIAAASSELPGGEKR